MDRIRWIRTALAVAQAGSFGGAAERLGASRSAVSKHVGALERLIGIVLFSRGRAGVQASRAGRAWLKEAAGALADMDALIASAGAIEPAPGRR